MNISRSCFFRSLLVKHFSLKKTTLRAQILAPNFFQLKNISANCTCRSIWTSAICFKKTSGSKKLKTKQTSAVEPSLDDFDDIVDSEHLTSQINSIETNLRDTFDREIILRPPLSTFENILVEVVDSSSGYSEKVELKMIAQLKSTVSEVSIDPVDPKDVEAIVKSLKENYSQSWPKIEDTEPTPTIKIQLMRVTKQYREQLCDISKNKAKVAKEEAKKVFDVANKKINKMKKNGEIMDDEYIAVRDALVLWNKFNMTKLDKLLTHQTLKLMNAD